MPIEEAIQTTMQPVETTIRARRTGSDIFRAQLRGLPSLADGERSEVERLRKLLREQNTASRRSQELAARTTKQLKTLETANARIVLELKRTRDLLTNATQEKDLEIHMAAERETSIWNQLLESRQEASTAIDSAGYRRKWLVALMGVAVPAMLWAGVSYGHSNGGQGGAEMQRTGDSAVTASVMTQAHAAYGGDDYRKLPVPDETVNRSDPGFAAGVARLDQAFDSFKGETPKEVLADVHAANAARGVSVCSFEWKNGQASLLFGSPAGTSLEASITNCADAVEKAAK
jgi:hypothetical protein